MTHIHDPFELVDSPWGHIERWRASTLATGTMGALAQVYDIVRNDADAAVARVEETEARKGLVQHLCDQISGLLERINRLEDSLEARHKADAEREQQEERERLFDAEPIPEPPGTSGPSVTADQHEPSAPVPSGELHDLPPKDASELPEPPLELEDALGDLPEELRDLPDPVEPPKGSVVQQPTALFGS
jgi:hypothetical protein